MISNTDLTAEERRQPSRAIQGNYMKIQSEDNNDIETGQKRRRQVRDDVTNHNSVRGLKYPILFLNRVSNVPLSIFPTLFAAIHNDIVVLTRQGNFHCELSFELFISMLLILDRYSIVAGNRSFHFHASLFFKESNHDEGFFSQ